MSLDPKKVPVQFDFIDDPQGKAEVLGSIQQVDQAVKALARNDGALLQAENFMRMEQAAKRAGTATQAASGGGVGGLGGKMTRQIGGTVGRQVGGEVGQGISTLTQNLGGLTAAGGLAAVAVIGVGMAMKELDKISEKLRREEELLLEARFAEIDAAGQTTEEIQRQIDEQTEIAEKAREKEAAAQERESIRRKERNSDELWLVKGIGDAIGIFEDGANEAQEAAEKWGDTAEDAKAQVEGLNDALDSTETAAADAAEALEKAAEAQTDAILDEVDAIGKNTKARQEASKRTRTENRERLKAIADQQAILKAQIAALKASGLATEEVIAKLAGLEKEMKSLGDEAGIVANAVKQGTSADREAAAERKRIREQENRERLQEQREAARERRQARLDEEFERQKEMIDFGNKIKKIEFDAAKSRYDIQINANRDQERLLREAAHAFENDFYQDFLGAFTNQNALAFQLQERQIAAGQSLEDVNRSSYLNQQETRAEAGYQQLSGPSGGNPVTINTGMDLNAVTQHLQSIGLVPNYG